MFPPETKILVVDDMLTMRKLVKKTLQSAGFTNFVEAVNGNDAWNKLNEPGVNFGLVLSDWNMPECQGIELLQRVRASEQLKDMPFVLLTAEGERDQIAEALKSGVDNYILKPFTAAVLKEKLAMVYKKRFGKKAA